ncbi:MAG: PKD domain-containing protein [Acidobacteria bacterium]|nr:PKD domain-containing protein [Acidobacteriota bacterium]
MIKSIGIGAAPVIATPPANAVVQAGQTTTLSVSGTGTAPLGFQWYRGESGDTSDPAAGATAAEFTPPPPTATTRYWVRVSNACGAADSPSATLSVNHRPVMGTVNVPAEAVVNEPVAMSATASDPDGDPVSLHWYIGTLHYSNTGSISHAFSSTGDKIVVISAYDGKGAAATVDVPVRVVTNAAPAFQSVSIPATGATGETLSFSAAAVDPDGDPVTFLWNFGDGSTAQGSPATHAYSAPGSFTVRVDARDKWGWTDTRTGTVTVSGNAYPVIQSVTIPGHRTAGSTVAFSVTATDPDGDTLTFTWSFGDGEAGATGPSGTHRYGLPGTYTVTVTVTDGYDGTAQATRSVMVTDTDGVTSLAIGSSRSGLAGAKGSNTYFKVVTPDDLVWLKVSTGSGSGNCDLYVKAGAKPTTSSYDFKSSGTSNTDAVEATQTTGKTWYLLLRGTAAYSGMTLTLAGERSATVGVNATVANLSGASGSRKYYRLVIPSGQTSLKVTTSGGTGNCNLYAGKNRVPSTSVYDKRSAGSTNAESFTLTVSGGQVWYLFVHGPSAYSGVILKTGNGAAAKIAAPGDPKMERAPSGGQEREGPPDLPPADLRFLE